MNSVMLEVRCCCVPEKLVGWLPTPNPNADHATFPLSEFIVGKDVFGEKEMLDVTTLGSPTITLKIQSIVNNGRQYRAINAEETPIETLKRIRGFVSIDENHQDPSKPPLELLLKLKSIVEHADHIAVYDRSLPKLNELLSAPDVRQWVRDMDKFK